MSETTTPAPSKDIIYKRARHRAIQELIEERKPEFQEKLLAKQAELAAEYGIEVPS